MGWKDRGVGDTVNTLKRKDKKTRKPPASGSRKLGQCTCLQRSLIGSALSCLWGPKILLSSRPSFFLPGSQGHFWFTGLGRSIMHLGIMLRLKAKERIRISQGPGAQRGLQGGWGSTPSVMCPSASLSMETEREPGRQMGLLTDYIVCKCHRGTWLGERQGQWWREAGISEKLSVDMGYLLGALDTSSSLPTRIK